MKNILHVKQVPPTLTNTWVFLGFSQQLKPETIQSIKIMDRDLVLWKSVSGKVSVMDAYCPHMGAHLGQGKIRGELLECIFHKRCFTSAGKCQGNGRLANSYPTCVNKNMIFAWFGTTVPLWDMPDLLAGFPGVPESNWSIFKAQRFNLNFHSKGMAENGVDASHFKAYHHFCKAYELPRILEKTNFRFTAQSKFLGYPLFEKLKIPHEIDIISENIGACTLIINSIVKVPKRYINFKFLYLASPVTADNTDYTLAMAIMDKSNRQFKPWKNIFAYFYYLYAFTSQKGEFIRETKQIWGKKSFLPSPDFSSNESVMKKFHDWYEQFYLGEGTS